MLYNYPAIFSRQRGEEGPLVASFVAPAGHLIKWASIERASHEGKGHQRLKNEARVRAIKRFLDRDNRNTIPTSLIIALQLPEFDKESIELGSCSTIEIPDNDGQGNLPGLVIDGQHRMYGVDLFDSELPLNIVALINPEEEEIAFQFLVINNKASKVSTDHVKFLSSRYQDDSLRKRLEAARLVLGTYSSYVTIVDNANDSPFYRSVKWPVESSESSVDRKDLVLPAAIEQAIGSIAKKKLPDLNSEDSLLEFFFTLWHAVQDQWPELWSPKSKLLQKVGLVTFTMFVIEDLVSLADRGYVTLSDPDQVDREIRKNILDRLTPEFWKREWTARSLDTSAGRQLVVEALTDVRRNIRSGERWDLDVSLIEPDRSN